MLYLNNFLSYYQAALSPVLVSRDDKRCASMEMRTKMAAISVKIKICLQNYNYVDVYVMR